MIQLFVTPDEYKKVWWFEILELCGPVFTLKDVIDKVEEVSGEKLHQNNIKRDLTETQKRDLRFYTAGQPLALCSQNLQRS